jgi:hypothetical protein
MPALAKLAAYEKHFRAVVVAEPLSDPESVSAAVQRTTNHRLDRQLEPKLDRR